MVKRPPVREKALTKETQLTRRKARLETTSRNCRRKSGAGPPAFPLPAMSRVSPTANQAMAPAARLASPQATKGASCPQFSASHPPGKGPMPTEKMNVP